MNIDKNKSDRDFTRKYLSLCYRYEIVGSGLDKITQSVIDGGYSDNQPFSDMRDDKDHKGSRQHLERFCSCADAEHPSGSRYQEYQPCKQVEYDGRELREEDTDPLYQGNCRNQRQYQQLKKYLYQSHVSPLA